MKREEAEYLLSLLACQSPSFDLVIRDTSGEKITPQDVAAALAKEGTIAEWVARVKYAGGSVDGLALRYFAHVLGPKAVKWQKKEATPPPGFHQKLIRLAAADCLSSRVCLVCNGRIQDYPQTVKCRGCGRSGRVAVGDRDRLKHLGLTHWGRWRYRYEAICHDLLNADARAIGAMYRHFS